MLRLDQVFPDAGGYTAGTVYAEGSSLSFARRRAHAGKPVIVNTIPKSGTYLFSRLLEHLGGINTGVHLSTNELWDFRAADVPVMRWAPDDFKTLMPIEESINLIRPGQYAVGHIDHTDQAMRLLSPFVHLFCVRNLRDVLVSHMRFVLDPRRREAPTGDWWQDRDGPVLFAHYLRGPGGRYFRNRISRIAGWWREPGVIGLRYETIMGDRGEDAQRRCVESIARYAGLRPPAAPLPELRRHVIGADTRTYSGRRSAFDDYASDEVEALLHDLGVNEVNHALGYE